MTTPQSRIASDLSTLNQLMVSALSLSGAFRTDDPQIGESYGIITPQVWQPDGSDSELLTIPCQIFVSASYSSYLAATLGAMDKALLLTNFLRNAKALLGEGTFLHFETEGSPINISYAAPVKSVDGQSGDVWIIQITTNATAVFGVARGLMGQITG